MKLYSRRLTAKTENYGFFNFVGNESKQKFRKTIKSKRYVIFEVGVGRGKNM
jgi:hypothetical protein